MPFAYTVISLTLTARLGFDVSQISNSHLMLDGKGAAQCSMKIITDT